MSSNGFDKATSKMLGSSVRIASPVTGGRMGREERERMRREAEDQEREAEASQRDEERKKVIRDLVELNMIRPAEAGAVAAEAEAGNAVPPEDAHEDAGAGADGKRGRGRPVKDPSIESYVGMSFRVPQGFRQRVKLLAVGRDCSVADLFDEAFGLLFAKYESPAS